MPHHAEHFLKKMRRVRILFGIAVCVMHAVKDGISAGIEIRGTLHEPCENVKELLPALVHSEHFMCCVTMQEKCLPKQRKVPVGKEEDENYH
jgi:hypothetical protein